MSEERTQAEIERDYQQMTNCAQWHTRCNEGCKGKYEHTEILWIYPESMSLDDRRRYIEMGSGMMATLRDQFGCDYIRHDMTPLDIDQMRGEIQTISEIIVDSVRHAGDETAVEITADHDSALPDGIEKGDLIGYRVTFGCPWKLNTLRKMMIDYNPVLAKEAGVEISGTCD